eukprot:SM000013S26507  [mRNA]  locus=s13:758458:762613:- [translate_table: standard]
MRGVVLHVDLDCFYAAVEQVRLGIPLEQPLAVQQWEGLIAINYAARARGITRHERAPEALRKCPELHLVHVEVIGGVAGGDRGTGKASLERYRQASNAIFPIFRRFASVCEKASIDEAFLDITAPVEEMVKGGFDVGEIEQLLKVEADRKKPRLFVLDGPLSSSISYDCRLLAGAVISARLRATLKTELGYTCSVGVASNKLLAKLGSSMNKPDGVTVIPPRAVATLMGELPLRKIRNLGGKLGIKLAKTGCETARDVQAVPQVKLVQAFGERLGNYVYNAVRGENDEAVAAKATTKSMLAAKTFGATSDFETLRRWMHVLAMELAGRMIRDARRNQRRPKTLQLYYRRPKFGDHSKSSPMPAAATHNIEQAAVQPRSAVAVDQQGHENNDAVPREATDQEAPGARLSEDDLAEGDEDDREELGESSALEDRDDELMPEAIEEPGSRELAEVLEHAALAMLRKAEGCLPCSRLALAAGDFTDLPAQSRSIAKFFSPALQATGSSRGPQATHTAQDMPPLISHRTDLGKRAREERMEVASGIRDYQQGACVDAYAADLHQSHLHRTSLMSNSARECQFRDEGKDELGLGGQRTNIDNVVEDDVVAGQVRADRTKAGAASCQSSDPKWAEHRQSAVEVALEAVDLEEQRRILAGIAQQRRQRGQLAAANLQRPHVRAATVTSRQKRLPLEDGASGKQQNMSTFFRRADTGS